MSHYDHIYELMSLCPEALNKQAIYEIMSKSTSQRKLLIEYITNKNPITPNLTYTDSLRHFLEFGHPVTISEYKYFVDAYVNKYFTYFLTKAPFNAFVNVSQDFWVLTYNVMLLITNDNDNKFDSFVKSIKHEKINISIDYLWSILENFTEKKLYK